MSSPTPSAPSAPAIPAAPLVLHLDNTLGAGFIGMVVTSIMFGITCLQTYIFYTRKNKDGWLLRTLVAILWMLDSLQFVFVVHAVYFYAVTKYGQPLTLLFPVWSSSAQAGVTAINDLIVRLIFARRIWSLSKNHLIIGIVVVLSLFCGGCGVAAAVKLGTLGSYANIDSISWIVMTDFAGIAATDTFIAAVLCYLLLRLRTGIRQTDSQLQTLVMYSINTGALTSVLAIVCLVAYATMPHNFIFIGMFFTLPKFLLNSLLASLNARDHVRRLREDSSGVMSIHLSKIQPPSSMTNSAPVSETKASLHGPLIGPIDSGYVNHAV